MENQSSPDKRVKVPPVPIKTYQWEDLRRDREAGAYPWTHLLKPKFEGQVTAEDILRETSPRRSMSREVSRERTKSRTCSPDSEKQKILNLDSSPGSSRKIGDDGLTGGINIPNFSKEISVDSEEDPIDEAVTKYLENQPKVASDQCLTASSDPITSTPKSVSPKSILKRRAVEPSPHAVEHKDGSKCCHPLVSKIKHIAEKTLHKNDKRDKSPINKQKIIEPSIIQLNSSPGAVRRQKYGAIKLGDSDEMSKTMLFDTVPQKSDHIYEDIEKTTCKQNMGQEKNIQFSSQVLDVLTRPLNDKFLDNNKEFEGAENKSNASQDPSLVNEEEQSENLKLEDQLMESLHAHAEFNKMNQVYNLESIQKNVKNEDDGCIADADSEEPDIEDIIKCQLQEEFGFPNSLNITITELVDDAEPKKNSSSQKDQNKAESEKTQEQNIFENEHKTDWSKSNSDHEYEIIEKPPTSILSKKPNLNKKQVSIEDELTSSTSLERSYPDNFVEDDEKNNYPFEKNSEVTEFQKEIEDRYFVSTPSTVSRTECEVSTSQVDSSALENLPLKRDSRTQGEPDSKLHQRFKEQKEKIRNQAGRIKSKLQNIKTRQFSLPDKSKFKLPQMPERPKFTMPERRKFSLPERSKFKKINISEKLSLDRKKFSFPERPKFTMPDMSKFKIPEGAKINFSSLNRKKEYRIEPDSVGSSDDVKNVVSVEFESKTYPRPLNRKKKCDPRVSSSPVLNRADTPPPLFSFVKISRQEPTSVQNITNTQAPREYGNIPRSISYENNENDYQDQLKNECDIVEIEKQYEIDFSQATRIRAGDSNNENTSSLPDVSPRRPEYTHVMNEINTDEFFVRPKGISRENIEVRQYLNDEIREAFKMPMNSLTLMDEKTYNGKTIDYGNGEEADPELYIDEEPEKTMSKELNDNDDGYYTFPPVRPSRVKKNKKYKTAMDRPEKSIYRDVDFDIINNSEFERNEEIEHFVDRENFICDSMTLPLIPKRKKKNQKCIKTNSVNDLRQFEEFDTKTWDEPEDIIVYRTEHNYTVPDQHTEIFEQSPLAPRRINRSRSSRGTSIVDDDRTSHGAESLTFDPNVSTTEHGYEFDKVDRPESPGYATVEKYPYAKLRRSKSKTPPAPRRRKSQSSDSKFYTVDRVRKDEFPDRPPRKKSSTSLTALENLGKESLTKKVNIEMTSSHKDLESGEIINKMRGRPLPAPPRPPRSTKKNKSLDNHSRCYHSNENFAHYQQNDFENPEEETVEYEVSTQTDPLPDDIDYELGIEENINVSMQSSLKDIAEDENINTSKTPKSSRPGSRSENSLNPTDPKLQELSKNNLGRTSPTVILVERRVSSPTRINEREEIVTEASLTVQPIDVEESIIQELPPLPGSEKSKNKSQKFVAHSENKAVEKLRNIEPLITEVQLDNLITQKLQVRDLDVGKLNVSELQASKIVVSDMEGVTLQVTELDSKSGHISVSGIELSPSVIDEIVKKITETVNIANTVTPDALQQQNHDDSTQTNTQNNPSESIDKDCVDNTKEDIVETTLPESASPPVRPPPPDLSPLLLSYLQDVSIPPASFYQLRAPRENPFTAFYESQSSAVPHPPTRRVKRKQAHQSGSSSDEDIQKRSPRRMPSSSRTHEQTITEAGAQFFRVCHNSISRTLRGLFKSLMSYINGNEDKKDVQIALVIFLVLIAGLIMFGLSDGRTVHHHHWEFFNPPDGTIK